MDLPAGRGSLDRRERLAFQNAREQAPGRALEISIEPLDLACQCPLDLRHHTLADVLNDGEVVGMEIHVIDAWSQRAERKRIQIEQQLVADGPPDLPAVRRPLRARRLCRARHRDLLWLTRRGES